MAWSQADYDTLANAIKDGIRVVRLDDRTIEYQSIEQMMKALKLIKSELASQSTTRRRPRAYLARPRKC